MCKGLAGVSAGSFSGLAAANVAACPHGDTGMKSLLVVVHLLGPRLRCWPRAMDRAPGCSLGKLEFGDRSRSAAFFLRSS